MTRKARVTDGRSARVSPRARRARTLDRHELRPNPARVTDGADTARVQREAARRRTFAIISHPDAGKTTLTEKLLLYAGAVGEAGSVTARRGQRAATSDWMDLERRRGISVTSTVLRFEHEDIVFNLLDTPGHKDFSEDTLRVLAAVDCAVILVDAARGVEPQTEQLFRVARARGIPLLAFVNKYDRPGMEPLEMLDHLTDTLGLSLAPLTWPVGIPGAFSGVIDRRDGTFHRFTRVTGGAGIAPENSSSFSVSVVLPASGWEMMAKVRRRRTCWARSADIVGFGARGVSASGAGSRESSRRLSRVEAAGVLPGVAAP